MLTIYRTAIGIGNRLRQLSGGAIVNKGGFWAVRVLDRKDDLSDEARRRLNGVVLADLEQENGYCERSLIEAAFFEPNTTGVVSCWRNALSFDGGILADGLIRNISRRVTTNLEWKLRSQKVNQLCEFLSDERIGRLLDECREPDIRTLKSFNAHWERRTLRDQVGGLGRVAAKPHF